MLKYRSGALTSVVSQLQQFWFEGSEVSAASTQDPSWHLRQVADILAGVSKPIMLQELVLFPSPQATAIISTCQLHLGCPQKWEFSSPDFLTPKVQDHRWPSVIDGDSKYVPSTKQCVEYGIEIS